MFVWLMPRWILTLFAQFPLTLAWAWARWKAQGTTLHSVRICMRLAVAGAAGVGYVAATRVKHVEHLVFNRMCVPGEVSKRLDASQY